MPTAERLVYVDSSALVKLVVREQWSKDVARFLSREADTIVSSSVAQIEVIRGVRVAEAGVEGEEEARELLASCVLLDVDRHVVEDARTLAGPTLGTLDAIHLASARRSGAFSLVTYDRELGRAAREHGIRVEAPGAIAS